MNALQSYSSDENSDDECRGRQTTKKMGSNSDDIATNYDDVGMDISDCEETGGEREASSAQQQQPLALKIGRPPAVEEESSDNPVDSRGSSRREDDSHRSHTRKDRDSPKGDRHYEVQERHHEKYNRSEEHRGSKGGRASHHHASRDQRYKSSSKYRRSRSPQSHSRSKEKRSRSKERRSRSRSRERRDRRRRSRSRERRDGRRGDRNGSSHYSSSDSKHSLLPTPPSLAPGSQIVPPPLLATPVVPTLPSYYNPSSVNAAKFAEAERKRKLLWGAKSCSAGVPQSCPIPGTVNNPAFRPPCLTLGNRANLGRGLNLGLGKDQFKLRESQTKDEGGEVGDNRKTGMTALWSTTTFNNDQDGRMAEKFKRLMGVKHGGSEDSSSSSNVEYDSSGKKLTDQQACMFSDMEKQYEVARQATHTHKGFGLGFTSAVYSPK